MNYTIQFSYSYSWPWKLGERNQGLIACYRSGLTEALKDELARAELPQSLGQLSDLAITLEKCLSPPESVHLHILLHLPYYPQRRRP